MNYFPIIEKKLGIRLNYEVDRVEASDTVFERVYGGDITVAVATFHVEYDNKRAAEKGKSKIESSIFVDYNVADASMQVGGSSYMVIQVDEPVVETIVIPVGTIVGETKVVEEENKEEDNEDVEKIDFDGLDDDYTDLYDDDDTPQGGVVAIFRKSENKIDSVGDDVQYDQPQQEYETKTAPADQPLEELENFDVFLDPTRFKVSNMGEELEEGDIPVDKSELAKMLDVSMEDFTFDFE